METLAGMNILIAEDNPADVYLLRESFRENGIVCRVSVVEDGERAIQYLERLERDGSENCPDVVLLDLNLPKIPGDEVITRIRKSSRCSGALIVVLTSSESPTDQSSALNRGADRYLHKPVNLEEFLRIGAELKVLYEART